MPTQQHKINYTGNPGPTAGRWIRAQELIVADLDAARIGEIAASGGYVLHGVTTQSGTLEEAFMELTRESVEYSADSGTGKGTKTKGGRR